MAVAYPFFVGFEGLADNAAESFLDRDLRFPIRRDGENGDRLASVCYHAALLLPRRASPSIITLMPSRRKNSRSPARVSTKPMFTLVLFPKPVPSPTRPP